MNRASALPHADTLTLVINLARSPERLEEMRRQLSNTCLVWERFDAIEGAKVSLPDAALVDPVEYARRHGKTYAVGELGCYLSHVYAYQRFLESEKLYALILEDDVQLLPQLEADLHGLYRHPEQWDLVKLSGVHRGTPLAVGKLGATTKLSVPLTRCTGSSAYLINRHAAQALCSNLLPMRLPFDHEFDRAWHYGFKLRIASPWPCNHDQKNESLINSGPATQRKFVWYKRLTAYAWRAHNEFKRICNAVAQVIRFSI